MVGVDTFHAAVGGAESPQQSSLSSMSRQGSEDDTLCDTTTSPVSVESTSAGLLRVDTEQTLELHVHTRYSRLVMPPATGERGNPNVKMPELIESDTSSGPWPSIADWYPVPVGAWTGLVRVNECTKVRVGEPTVVGSGFWKTRKPCCVVMFSREPTAIFVDEAVSVVVDHTQLPLAQTPLHNVWPAGHP